MEQKIKYLSNYEERYNNVLLSLFKALLEILTQNNLQYWACAGTVLGAIRHKGLIPWDDDIDIYMPRADYNKLLELAETKLPAGFKIVSPRNKGYYLPFAKFINSNTTIWELADCPFIIGVFIDIFPLDYADGSHAEIIAHKKECIRNWAKYYCCISSKKLFDLFKGKHYRLFLYKLLYGNKGKSAKFLTKYEDVVRRYSSDVGHVAVCWSDFPEKLLDRLWFDDYIVVPFEGLEVRVPKGYNQYLTYVYGDYMELPPVNQRIPKHERYYINLEEGLTLDEVKERIKQGEFQK